MIVANDLNIVRNKLDTIVGHKITLISNSGRKRSSVQHGTLEKTYPSIFVVLLDGEKDNSHRRISFSYTDILTKAIELSPVMA